MYTIYIYESNILNPIKKCKEKKGKEEGLGSSNTNEVNLIKVGFTYHKETPGVVNILRKKSINVQLHYVFETINAVFFILLLIVKGSSIMKIS
jgi:hypothetical protein